MPPPPSGPGGAPAPPGSFYAVAGPPGSAIAPAMPDYAGAIYGAPPPTSTVGMPSAFDTTGPGASLVPTDQNNSLPSLAEVDLSVQCDPVFLRSTVSKLHVSQVSANAARIPLGIICKPMAGDIGQNYDCMYTCSKLYLRQNL